MADILVVDDEGFIRTTLGAVLRRAGHTVRLAPDGGQGLALFIEQLPHLVITDIIMPPTDGYEMIRAMRETSATVPIIAISGALDPDDFRRTATSVGATLAMAKPLGLNELLVHVEQLLAKPN